MMGRDLKASNSLFFGSFGVDLVTLGALLKVATTVATPITVGGGQRAEKWRNDGL